MQSETINQITFFKEKLFSRRSCKRKEINYEESGTPKEIQFHYRKNTFEYKLFYDKEVSSEQNQEFQKTSQQKRQTCQPKSFVECHQPSNTSSKASVMEKTINLKETNMSINQQWFNKFPCPVTNSKI